MIGADYFAQDPRDDKLNLTVGVYQDEHGHTPILQAVKEAEQILLEWICRVSVPIPVLI